MRLVSAVWKDYHPFDRINGVNSLAVATHHDDLEPGDCLIVWGGADIHPSLYNKGRSRFSGASNRPSQRDTVEWTLMHRAKELGVPIIGVCRGAQMLCALSGGTLIQHVNNHGGYHPVATEDGLEFKVNSMHHQMMNPTGTNHNIVAWTKQRLSDVYFDVDNEIEVDKEPEFIHFPDVKGFAIQWHPECMDGNTAASVYINRFIEERL